MGKTHAEMSDDLKQFIEAQKLFFVATAPTGTEGHINVSPKGHDSLRILGPKSLAYLDLYGSGIETVAHLRQNGRITIMLCAFDGPPRIVRLYGKGVSTDQAHSEFPRLRALFPAYPGTRSIIRVELDRIADSCGFAVPLFRFEAHRHQLLTAAEKRGADGVAEYCRQHNAVSIDGLPGLF
ncbi:MAG: pyridoxamine 5'-phosphate oxidase family protein [Acidobacteria bacterium]|nr:pyridoxamine 5'-phosphate oxidase family protein [Acidobacteriota bacterium]